jgi:pentatricopeptide repeat protein
MEMASKNPSSDEQNIGTHRSLYTSTMNMALNELIHCLASEDSLRLFYKMESSQNIRPDVTSYNIAIVACQASKKIEEAFRLFETLKHHRELGPDVVTYNSMIAVCGQCKDVDAALAVFQEMKKSLDLRVRKPDDYTYRSLLAACAESQRWEETKMLFQEAKLSAAVHLDETLYTSMMKACGLSGNPGEVISIFKEMLEQGITPDAAAYGVAFSTMARCPHSKLKAEGSLFLDAFDSMQRQGIRPDAQRLSDMMMICQKVGDATAALRLYREAKVRFTPQLQTYERLIQTCGEAQRIEDALEVFREFKDNVPSAQFKNPVVVYNALMKVCSMAGQAETAKALFQVNKHETNLEARRGRVQVSLLSSSIFSIERKSKPRISVQILSHTRSSSVRVDATGTLLQHGHFLRKCRGKASLLMYLSTRLLFLLRYHTSCVVLCCVVLCCVVLCCVVLCRAVLCCVVLSCRVVSCCVVSCVLFCLVLSCLVLPFLCVTGTYRVHTYLFLI